MKTIHRVRQGLVTRVGIALGFIAGGVCGAMSGSLPSVMKALGGKEEKRDVKTPLQRLAKQLESLQQESQSYEVKQESIRARIEQLSDELVHLKQRPVVQSASLFVTKKQAFLAQQHATLIEQEGTLQRIQVLIEKRRVLLEEKLVQDQAPSKDPVGVQSLYGFHDIQAAMQLVADIQSKLVEEERGRTIALDEFSKRRKALTLAETEYAERKLEQENFATSASVTGGEVGAIAGLSASQQGALIDVVERLSLHRKDLAVLRSAESEHKIALFDAQIEALRVQLTEGKRSFARMRKSARVSREFVRQTDELLEHKRAAMLLARETTNGKLRMVNERRLLIQEKLRADHTKDSQQVVAASVAKWLEKTPSSIAEWIECTQSLDVVTDNLLYQVEYEFFTAQAELENAQFRKEELEAQIIRAWHRITIREARYRTDEEVEQDIKAFELVKAELEGQLISLTSGLDSAVTRLDQFNTNFDRLRKLILHLAQQRYNIFGKRAEDYTRVQQHVEELEEKTRRLLHWGGRLFDLYSSTISVTKNNMHRVDGIVRELSSRAFWRRSDFSIDLSDLKSFVPDIKLFSRDLQQGFAAISGGDVVLTIIANGFGVFSDPWSLMMTIGKLLLLILGFWGVRMVLPQLSRFFLTVARGNPLTQTFVLFIAALCRILYQHILLVYLWLLGLGVVWLYWSSNPFLAQSFSLLTIPLGMYLVIRLIHACIVLNGEQSYRFISEGYEVRFFVLTGVLLGAVVLLLGVREAFMLGEYHHSPVPSILLSVLFMVGQVCLIGLVGRTQIVGLIPADTPLREWLHELLDRYYYVIWCMFVAIIVMSTPLVGYGRQVYYIVSRLLLTGAFISLLSWIHNRVKRGSLDLFFYYADRDVIKERFVTGRFWYSIFVLSTLVVFATVGVYVTARVWGYSIGIRDMISWLQYSFYNPTDEVSGKVVPVSVLSVLYIVFHLCGGFVIAYIINTFIISRVLDPFIVEPGVQSTILTLLRYVIIMLALFMGLSTTGLEGLMTKIGVVLVALGFAIKEILSDFFSYFILLVQRPVKVGDFIRVLDNLSNEEPVSLTGFVRAITPRSIIIRKRNSTTVVIPNSRVVTNPVMNWSYSRGFFAFDDMRITVPYGVDPQLVRQLFLEVMEKNQNILKNPAPVVRLEDFVDNGYSFLIRGYITSHKIGEQWDIASEVRFQLVRALREQNIEVASPTRMVKMVGVIDKGILSDTDSQDNG